MLNNIERLREWCSINDITIDQVCPTFMGSEVIYSIKYKGYAKTLTGINLPTRSNVDGLINMLNIWKQMIDLDHVRFTTPDYAIEQQSESRAHRLGIIESLPPVPIRHRVNCSFCDAKDLDNFYTGASNRIACSPCFKTRVDKKLAKEKV